MGSVMAESSRSVLADGTANPEAVIFNTDPSISLLFLRNSTLSSCVFSFLKNRKVPTSLIEPPNSENMQDL